MFIEDRDFQVEFTTHAEKHFCKDFFKKYKKSWLMTKKTVTFTLERAHQFEKRSLVSHLNFTQEENAGIFKLRFAIAGSNTSPKTSGNRAIFYLSNNSATIRVLLVYSKDHCSKNQSETQWIKEQIKSGFPEYKKLVV